MNKHGGDYDEWEEQREFCWSPSIGHDRVGTKEVPANYPCGERSDSRPTIHASSVLPIRDLISRIASRFNANPNSLGLQLNVIVYGRFSFELILSLLSPVFNLREFVYSFVKLDDSLTVAKISPWMIIVAEQTTSSKREKRIEHDFFIGELFEILICLITFFKNYVQS